MPTVMTPTTGCDLDHRQRDERPSSIFIRNEMAVQTRRCCTGGRLVGDANVGADLVLVADVGGREVHAPLPYDEWA
jgi:hypothetical protein